MNTTIKGIKRFTFSQIKSSIFEKYQKCSWNLSLFSTFCFVLDTFGKTSNCLKLNTFEDMFSSQILNEVDGFKVKQRFNFIGSSLLLTRYKNPLTNEKVQKNAKSAGFDAPIQFPARQTTKFYKFSAKKLPIWKAERECANYQGTLPLVNSTEDAAEILKVNIDCKQMLKCLSWIWLKET